MGQSLRNTCTTMKILIIFSMYLYSSTATVSTSKIQNTQLSIARSSRETLPDCEDQLCKDCRSPCTGCNNCPLCKLLEKTCSKGKKLKFGGADVCEKCKYCKNGKEECNRLCNIGKTQPKCLHCIDNCPAS